MRPIFTTLFLGISLSLAACSAAPGDDVENDEVGQANDELSATKLVGHYYNHQQGPGDFYTLNLEKGGKFTAKVDITDRAFCITAPCVSPEKGTWSTYTYRGENRIRINVQGGASQTFSLVKTAQTLKLTRSGHSQTLKIASDAVCDTDADCSANEECQQRMCLMYCPAGDPDCCGPATCQPKPSPVQCGRNTCATGEVCCNPLMGICTPPGGVCAF